MAGNIVKWWKHKILGGYKQFSVLQECTTDSEELMYPIRAPSSCSAPPDLLLVSDRENVQRKSPVNIISTSKSKHQQNITTPNSHNHHHHHHQNQHHHQHQQHQQKESQAAKQSSHNKNSETTTNHGIEGPHQKNQDDERMHLEEFTCDVSVEGGKSSQPLQFSFTFYDLDGHHGKITKDDIVGIVYTIYESIGKNVVVPHCGSKTINVRLTVSPEGKSKSTGKHKKMHASSVAAAGQQHSRRQHRYRPRKLIKSDDEEDEGDSGSEREISNDKKAPTTSKFNKLNAEAANNQKPCCSEGRINQDISPGPQSKLIDSSQNSGKTALQQSSQCKFPTAAENIYESVANIKCCPKESRKDELDGCKECAQSSLLAVQQQQQHQQYLKQASIRAKILRKARKQKYQEQCYESRQRSLSVGNETCWKVRSGRTAQDDVDGRTVPTAECWNNALKRNDLIDIIRESMEKNRLCFQSNGKPQQNVSPVRHRQRSNTTTLVPKIIDENLSPQTSHHVPIYHQQMAINPAILAQSNRIAHSKTNLCGYDSFLHATICSTVNNSTQNAVPNQHQYQQQSLVNSPKIYVNSSNIAKSSKLLKNGGIGGYHSQQNSPQFHGYQRLSSSHGYNKLNTSLLSALNPHMSAEDKLNRTIDHVEKWLSERDQGIIKANDLKILKYAGDESKCKKDVKNYDNLLHSKLETPKKLVQDNNVINNNNNNNNNRENIRRLHHSQHYQILQQRNSPISPNSAAAPVSLDKTDTSNKFVTLIPVDAVDPIECENLIHPTSDEDTLPSTPSGSANGAATEGGESGVGNSNNGNNSNSSSTVHRYVHEHIHHHYHHFENKQN